MNSLSAAIGLAAVACAAACAQPAMDAAARPDAVSVPRGKTADLKLPPLPAKAGKVTVLRFRAVIVTGTEAGCNYNATVRINGEALGLRAANGDERLLGRDTSFELTAQRNLAFPVFNGDKLMMMFAPSAAIGDGMSTDGQGATFLLDIGDAVRGVDGNTVTFENKLPEPPENGTGALQVEDIAVGWLDRASLPQPKTAVPMRGQVRAKVAVGAISLAQSARGGFVVTAAGGPDLLVETGIGMRPDVTSTLIADDAAQAAPNVKVATEPWGPAGFRMTAILAGLTLTRTVAVRGDLVEWKERWTNTGDAIAGVPFRHRFFLRSKAGRFRIGGAEDAVSAAGSASNPTLFVEAERGEKGFGVTAESDWLRLLMSMRARSGVGEMLTDTLALPPKGSIDFDLTITPVARGGYWTFINGLRERWGVNGIVQERPVFWTYARAPGGKTPEEQVRKALAHLGPIYVVIGPWQRLEPDAQVVAAGTYPKLPPGAPRAPGACPDFDVDTFLTLAHREAYWEGLKAEADLIRRAAPQAKVMSMLHPAMEAVYKPLEDRWAIAGEAIRRADGSVFEDPGYSKAWMGNMVDKGWVVNYYVPRPGSTYLGQILAGVDRGLDQCGLDGIYSDEFSWAYNTRGYSRYDYSRWDGYSADLDESGKVVHLKSDNAFVTEASQLQIMDAVLRRGRFFLNNGGNALRSVGSVPHARFVEGGNGVGGFSQGHLSPVPLILGNMGDEKSRRGVLQSVRTCLAEGCVYSPSAVNLLLDGPDNFVCKLYPISVEEIGPGWVVGHERLATSVSRSFAWPADGGKVLLYRYDADGKLMEPKPGLSVRKGDALRVDVPKGGLVIAERG